MSAPVTSRDEARKLVQSIAQNHGYIDEDDWKLVPSDVRERLQNAVGGLQGIAGVTISTLATNIYTSDARFVFELLQNAEDNSFHKAREANLTRYVSFEVHPDHIITECNEDGFESKNLKAICDIGKSSKTGVQNGYIGPKGHWLHIGLQGGVESLYPIRSLQFRLRAQKWGQWIGNDSSNLV